MEGIIEDILNFEDENGKGTKENISIQLKERIEY